jgi:site-specific DNA-methyltransferase (adenine-specific)
MTRHRILTGDCAVAMKAMADNSVDMIMTDPPYGHSNNNGDLIARREAALGRGNYEPQRDNRPIANDGPEANDLVRCFFAEAHRILKPGGCCCCCCCGGGGPDPQFARWSLWLDEAFNGGFKQMVVWDKGPIGMGWHYRRSYEVVLVAQKAGANCRWYDTTHRVENIIRPGTRGIRKILPTAEQHPTEKPWQLGAFFIRLHTQPGETVLDPFCGSGAFGEAATRLGRSYIGIELDPGYAEMSRRRLDAIERQGVLL